MPLHAAFSKMDDNVNKEFSLCTIGEFGCLKRLCHQHRRNDFKQMASGFGNRLRQRLRPIICLGFVNDGIDVHTRGPAEDVIEHTRVPGFKWISIMFRTGLSMVILSVLKVLVPAIMCSGFEIERRLEAGQSIQGLLKLVHRQ